MFIYYVKKQSAWISMSVMHPRFQIWWNGAAIWMMFLLSWLVAWGPTRYVCLCAIIRKSSRQYHSPAGAANGGWLDDRRWHFGNIPEIIDMVMACKHINVSAIYGSNINKPLWNGKSEGKRRQLNVALTLVFWCFFPTCQVVRFYKSCSPPPSPSPPRPPALCRHVRHHLRQLCVASCRLQCAMPDLARGALERSVQCRTFFGELPSGECRRGAPERSVQRRTSPGSARAECAAPDPSCQKRNRKYVRKKEMSGRMSKEMSIEMPENISE